MPITSHVTLLRGDGLRPAGDYFRAAADGAGGPADIVAVAVEAGGRLAADASLEAALPASAARGLDQRRAGRVPACRRDASGDRLWRMPLAQQYLETLDSPVADLSQISRDGSNAGSIFAALFLRQFAGERAWAHLDIAGTSRVTSDDGELTKGATGFGTRLLLRWLGEG